MRFATLGALLTTGLMALSAATSARADEALEAAGVEIPPTIGIPSQDGLGFQPAATSLMSDLIWLDDFLLVIITAITLFVTALMAIVVVRFRESANPTPATWTHNSLVEVLWTVIPIVILIVIAVPSLRLLDKQLTIPEGDVVIKATGQQWAWSYEYPDEEIAFDAYMVAGGYATWDIAQAEAGDEIAEFGVTRETWGLATDTAVVVPVGKDIKLQVTGADVIHAWTIPAFGVKIDAMPGRLNETWFNVDKPGVYYGQCSELCGKDHAYMPIKVVALEEADYEAWLDQARDLYAAGPRSTTVAAAD